jgi:hypothetical protein
MSAEDAVVLGPDMHKPIKSSSEMNCMNFKYKLVLSKLMAMMMIMRRRRNAVVWDLTPCSLLGGHQSFGESYSLHLQERI